MKRAAQHGLGNVTAAILAGGLGTRLRSVVGDRPKPLALVHDRPYLTYLLDRLADAGLREVVLLTGHGADAVRQALGETYRDLRLVFSPEPLPLGTAGAVRWALPRLQSPLILLMNGDSWCDVDLAAFREFHDESAAEMSLVLAETSDASRYGRVGLTRDGRVTGFGEKDGVEKDGLINAGIYLLACGLVDEIPAGRPVSLERDMIPQWLHSGRPVYGFRGSSRFLDIGTPESYAEAAAFFQPHA